MKKTMWCGRFDGEQHPLFQAFNHSIVDDVFLASWDIKTSRAHAKCLRAADIIDDAAYQLIDAGLIAVLSDIETGRVTPASHDEDVHMWIERLLTERIGQTGKKLHTGRSRNDQVATTVKLWLKDAMAEHAIAIKSIIEVLLDLAGEHIDTIMPGCTHLQAAQPISLAYYFTAQAQRLKRDVDKAEQLVAAFDYCPLGSGAIAGSNFDLSRQLAADTLGFSGYVAHAMDAISDRDFLCDYLYFASLLSTHLSQLAEDFIIWQSPNFRYIELSDSFSSGSSLMPQKKNPDGFELMRAKAAVISGRLNGLFGVLKGLPMSYNKDLQEDKRLIVATYRDIDQMLALLPGMLACTTYHTATMAQALSHSYANATDMADMLVMRGLPFRDAHHVVGKIVAYAISNDKEIFELSVAALKDFCPLIDGDMLANMSYRRVMENKKTAGSTNSQSVKNMIAQLQQWLEHGDASHE